MRILVTGGCGFIGSAVVRELIRNTDFHVCNIDKLTYAADLTSVADVAASEKYNFYKIDICNEIAVGEVFESFKPDAVIHLAAESHVDNSILSAREFIQTNIFGTFCLLEAARTYWTALPSESKNKFRFLHVSTDEVFGDLGETTALFTEDMRYDPSSPYSASKASSDHIVRAWYRTYGLPTLVTNCSNNYGPYQNTEKLIPLTIKRALNGENIPIYGDGTQVRDWLFVEDHARALIEALLTGVVNESYNIGGHNEIRNIDVVTQICELLHEAIPLSSRSGVTYTDLISFVEDRPGHDTRYAIDASKIQRDLGWKPRETFESGIRKTIHWYIKEAGSAF